MFRCRGSSSCFYGSSCCLGAFGSLGSSAWFRLGVSDLLSGLNLLLASPPGSGCPCGGASSPPGWFAGRVLLPLAWTRRPLLRSLAARAWASLPLGCRCGSSLCLGHSGRLLGFPSVLAALRFFAHFGLRLLLAVAHLLVAVCSSETAVWRLSCPPSLALLEACKDNIQVKLLQ